MDKVDHLAKGMWIKDVQRCVLPPSFVVFCLFQGRIELDEQEIADTLNAPNTNAKEMVKSRSVKATHLAKSLNFSVIAYTDS